MKVSARPIVLAVVVAGIGVFAGLWMAKGLLHGSYLTALIAFGVTVWGFGFALYHLYTTSRAAKPRADREGEATFLRPARFVDLAFILPSVAISVAAALYLLFAPLGKVDYVPTGVMRTLVPFSCGALLLFTVPTLYRMILHRGHVHLRADPTEFEVWNGHWGTLRRGTWDGIEDILDRPAKGGRPFNEVIVVALEGGREAVLVADAITGNTGALRKWVHFYWKNPEFRDELADDRGLRRLDQEDFVVG